MINKYDKAVAKDWSWKTMVPKLPELDVKGFGEVLAQQQSQVDQVGLLSDKKPDVLNNDPDLEVYKNYQDRMQKGLDHVSQEYNKGVTSGQLAYKNYLAQFRKDWSPGGEADLLNKRYGQYQAGVKAIDDFYKDDSSPVNKTLAKQQLQAQLKNPINLDPSTGKYTSISTPELYKNPDINKAINEMLQEIKANGDTQFLGDSNRDWWLQKIQSETREPERIKLAFQALSQQPEFASQIARDTEYKTLQTDPVKYEAAFKAQQQNALDRLDKNAIEASNSKDPQVVKDWQNHLRSQGYNIKADGQYGDATDKASKDFYDKQKAQVKANVDNFDFKTALQQDVTNSYLGYATRGAYKKIEKSLIFNQAKKAQMDYSLKAEENRIARYAAEMEFAPKENSNVVVTSGLAQQLPDIQTYYKETKDLKSETEKNINKAISKDPVFQGWELPNVAEAYNVWQKVRGNTEDEKKANYKSLLEANSDYPFSDEQVDKLYMEMNAPDNGSGFKSALVSFGQINSELNRLEEGQMFVAEQYLGTTEGKAGINQLRKVAPTQFRNLSDDELAKKALTDPDAFIIKGQRMPSSTGFGSGKSPDVNPAEGFTYQMSRDVKNHQANGVNYNWGSLGTAEVHATSKDKYLGPVMDGLGQALETSRTGLGYSTFGEAGLTFRNFNGDKVSQGKTMTVKSMAPSVNGKGDPIVVARVIMTNPGKGGGTYEAYTEIDVADPVLRSKINSGLEKAYAIELESGDKATAQKMLRVIQGFEGVDGKKDATKSIMVENLNLTNTTPQEIYQLSPTGELVDVRTLGWGAKDLEDNRNIGGYGYQTIGFSTYGSPVVANVFTDAQGRRIIAPDLITGEAVYDTPFGASAALKSREILAKTPVEVKERKVRGGTESSSSSKTVEIHKTNE